MQVKSTIKLNMPRINQLTRAAVVALEQTAEALHTEVVQAQVMPFDTGNLQNESTFVDTSEASSGKVSLVCVMSEVGGKVYPVHNNVFKFGTKGMDSVDGDMVMPADLENFAPTIDGTTEEWYAMDAEGWAKSAMTGKKLSFAFKGKRSVGDAGNDYIAGLAWKFGQDVMTKFEWTMTSGAKLACDVVVNVTTPGGGDTTNIDALEFEVTCYGKPTYTPVVAA